MLNLPISRKEESNFPAFDSYMDAAAFFEEKYGKNFILQDVETIDGVKCYFHAVVADWDVYRKGQSMFMQGKSMSGDLSMAYISCYQPIQIFEDGRVHIVH